MKLNGTLNLSDNHIMISLFHKMRRMYCDMGLNLFNWKMRLSFIISIYSLQNKIIH